jgi:hypothetical protein
MFALQTASQRDRLRRSLTAIGWPVSNRRVHQLLERGLVRDRGWCG